MSQDEERQVLDQEARELGLADGVKIGLPAKMGVTSNVVPFVASTASAATQASDVFLPTQPSSATVASTTSHVTTYHGTQQSWRNPQEDPLKTQEVRRGGKIMSPFFYDILSICNSHPHEKPVADIIIKHILNKVHNLAQDEKGDIVAEIYLDGKDTEAPTRSETVFSCHMDTVNRGENAIVPMVTTEAHKPDGAGFIYGATKVVEVSFTDMESGEIIPSKNLALHMRTIGAGDTWQLKEAGFNPIDKQPIFAVRKFKDQDDKVGEMVDGKRFLKQEPKVTYKSSILGADDKVGVYIMSRMIDAGIPGMYIFHVGEECGGIGSSFLAKTIPDTLKRFKRAVAFDRTGYENVITRQAGGDCCSTEFAKALGDQININFPSKCENKFSPCSGGVFTDTANYTAIIPECTNLSIGYFGAHGSGEHFDMVWLDHLFIPAILKVEWELLPTVRDPKKKPSYEQPWRYRGNGTTYHNPKAKVSAVVLDKKVSGKRSKKLISSTKGGLIVNPGSKYDPNDRINRHRVAPEKVQANTPLIDIPLWTPDMGLINGIPEHCMDRIIAAYLERTKVNYYTAGRIIRAQMQDVVSLELCCNEYEEELNEALDKVTNKDQRYLDWWDQQFGMTD